MTFFCNEEVKGEWEEREDEEVKGECKVTLWDMSLT